MAYSQISEEFELLLRNFDVEKFDQMCRTLQICLLRGNILFVRQALNEYIRSLGERSEITLDSPVDLLFDIKTANALSMNGYQTVRAVAGATDSDLLRISNFGVKQLDIVRSRIAEIGKREVSPPSYDDILAMNDRMLAMMTPAGMDRRIADYEQKIAELKRLKQRFQTMENVCQ